MSNIPEHGESGRFQPRVTLDVVLDMFDEVDGPVIASSDVTDVHECSGATARRKLNELSAQGQISGREIAGRTVWWRTDTDTEEVSDDV